MLTCPPPCVMLAAPTPDRVIRTMPTIGFNMETVVYKNLQFNVWDLGPNARSSQTSRRDAQAQRTISTDRRRCAGLRMSPEKSVRRVA